MLYAVDGQTLWGQGPDVIAMFLAVYGSEDAAERAWVAEHEREIGYTHRPPVVGTQPTQPWTPTQPAPTQPAPTQPAPGVSSGDEALDQINTIRGRFAKDWPLMTALVIGSLLVVYSGVWRR